MTSATAAPETPAPGSGPTPEPIFSGKLTRTGQALIYTGVIVPTVALIAAVPLAWGWGLGWTDVGLAVAFYLISGLGVTIGFHRLFTHGSFKAKPWLRVLLAVAGSLSFQGSVVTWVADHRRHHAYSDKEGDPHSPWLFGTGPGALVKGFWHSHMGWLFRRDQTNAKRFAPDLLADRGINGVDKLFGVLAAASLLLPGVLGALITWSWWGGVTALFWAGLVRIAVLHHITWSTNSVCHMIGERPFVSRDKAANFWPLAVLSFGESWHNLHHADPTCARHGVLRGQLDISARIIWFFEKFGWAWNVRWPNQKRLARITATA